MRALLADGRRLLRGLLPAAAVILSPACSQQPPAKTAGSAPLEARAEGAQPASAPAASAAAPAPAPTPPPAEPERTWLVDDEGREYYVEPIAKVQGKYQIITEQKVMLFGAPVEIVGHDDQWFYTKFYKIDRSIKRPLGRRRPPTPEEVAAAAATYVPETPSGDRLRFVPFDAGLPKNGQWRNGFDLADINRDGHLDIVHPPPRKGGGAPVIFLGDGRGNWKSWLDLRVPRPYDYGDTAVADFNGDGHLDLALGIHLRGLRVLVGDGKGVFKEWSGGLDYEVPGQGGTGAGFSSRALVAVDWNGDGRPDLLALGEGPRPARPTAEERRRGLTAGGALLQSDGPVVFFNQGDGTWVKREQRDEDMEIFGDSLVVGDFDGDGRPDFATSSGILTRRDLVNLGIDGGAWRPVELAVRPGGYVPAVAAADLDGNGRDDLAVAYLALEAGSWRTGVDVHFAQPDGTWRRRVVTARDGRETIYGLDLGDLDGDGALDLFTVDSEGRAQVFLGDGKGFFVGEASPELDQPVGRCRGYQVRLADLDADGGAEVVVSFADEADALFDPERCPSSGGLAAWKAQPAP